MEFANGQVTINDEPTKSKLYRFCEKKIDQWLQSRIDPVGPNAGSAGAAEFTVSFTEEPDTSQIGCMTEIHLGDSVWRGWDLDSDTQQAFIHSLKRLQPH